MTFDGSVREVANIAEIIVLPQCFGVYPIIYRTSVLTRLVPNCIDSYKETSETGDYVTVPQSVFIATPKSIELGIETSPIYPGWIKAGNPLTRTKCLLTSSDLLSTIVVWECTAGQFRWHYNSDETLFVISGEAFITMDGGKECRLGPGDLGYFPAGTSCVWRVPESIKKFAMNRETVGRPMSLFVRGSKKILRMLGLETYANR